MRFWIACVLAFSSGVAAPAGAASAKIIKVLPHYLDLQGRHSISPSLYDRDAYQAQLKKNPQLRSGLRFDVQWRSAEKSPLKLRVEMRGNKGKELTHAVLEQTVGQTGFSKWTGLILSGDDYQKLGELAAWRATLWEGGKLISEQKSFLW
jgi:hypothetical protein